MRTITTLLVTATLIGASASTAKAAVVYFINQDIPIPTTFAGVSVNLETGASSLALAGVPGADMNFVLGGAGVSNDADETAGVPSWQPVRTGPGNSDVLENLGIGTVVGPGSVTGSGFGGSLGHFPPFVSGTKGFIGFSVVLEDATVAYGWVEVTLQSDNTPGVIHRWAYEDTGAPLAVGVPEPSHMLLVVLGLSISVMRRHR